MTKPALKDEGELSLDLEKPALKRPPLYKVILLNDDFTPMDFVTHLLRYFFCMEESKATNVMWQIHTQGKGVCGVFSKDVAETKVLQIVQYARSHEHPLICEMEPESMDS